MTPFAYDVLGASCGIAGAAVAVISRYWPRPRTGAAAPAAGPVLTAFRYCPAEMRTRAVVPHVDGTATCSCGTHIPTAGGEQR